MKQSARRIARYVWHSISRPYPIAGTTAQQREGIKYLWYDLLFANLSAAFYTEFVTLFILELGGTSAMIGSMSSVNNAMAMIGPLLGAMMVARSGKRKIWVIAGAGGVGRLTLVLSAVVPLIFNGLPAVLIVIGLMCIRSLAAAWSMPPHNSLQGDIIPLGIRARWNSLGMMAASAITVLIVPLSGWIIRMISGAAGYQATFLISSILGFVATWFYSHIPEPAAGEGTTHQGAGALWQGWRIVTKDRRFMLFCGVQFVWSFGIQLSAPFFSVYMREDLGFSVDTIALLATGTAVVNTLVILLAGKVITDKNAPKVTAIGMLLVPLMPVAWYLASGPWGVLGAKVYGVCAWAWVNVSGLPLILSITPREQRAQFIAFANMTTAIAAIIAPLPAGWIYGAYGFKVDLLLSAAVRGLGGIIFMIMYLRGAFSWSYDERASAEGTKAA